MQKQLVKQRLEAKKLSEYDLLGKNAIEWLALLRRVWKTIGLPAEKYPPEDERDIVTNTVLRSFGSLTMMEFLTAFELAVDGKLNLTYEQINHFHNFQSIYVATILNAYLEWRKPVIQEINKLRLEEINKPKTYTKDQQLEINRRFLYSSIAQPYYQYLKTGEINFGVTSINHIFQTLEDMKIIVMTSDQKRDLTKQVWDKFKKTALDKLSAPSTSKTHNKNRELIKKAMNGKDPATKKMMVQEECRRLVLHEFFAKHKESGKDIVVTLGIKKWLDSKIDGRKKGT